jgi:hypothetical protein
MNDVCSKFGLELFLLDKYILLWAFMLNFLGRSRWKQGIYFARKP